MQTGHTSVTNAKPSHAAVRLGGNFHKVLSIMAARGDTSIKQLVEKIVAADPEVRAAARHEGIELEVAR